MENSDKNPAPIGEIQLGPSAFEQFMDKNQKKLLIAVILAVLGFTAVVVLNGVRQGKLQDAGHAFVNAKTVEELQAVTKNHSNTPSAGSALLSLAEKQWSDDKKQESIATLKDFLTKFSDHPAATSARVSLGTKLMTEGNLDEAKTTLQPLTSPIIDKFASPIALITLGDIAREQGNLDEAEEHYEHAKDSFSGSDRALESLIKERIGIVRATTPTLIDPPKKEESAVENPITPPIPVTPGQSIPGQNITIPTPPTTAQPDLNNNSALEKITPPSEKNIAPPELDTAVPKKISP